MVHPKYINGVASGKCGFTTLRKFPYIKKPNFSAEIKQALKFPNHIGIPESDMSILF